MQLTRFVELQVYVRIEGGQLTDKFRLLCTCCTAHIFHLSHQNITLLPRIILPNQ